jgi:ABC-2 type transport system ATP-binding protein
VKFVNAIIKLSAAEKAFSEKKALNHIDLEIQEGEIFGLLGPSGSGKTTMVKVLTSSLKLTSGEAHVLNYKLPESINTEFYAQIGVMTDHNSLYERLTVYENLKFYCQLYQVPLSRIEHVLNDVNLLDEQKTKVANLSKGMKQRIELARVLLHKPDLLFLDEPTSALDPSNVKAIHETLRKLNKEGTTIFLTTHNMWEAEELCDRVAFLDKGHVVAIDTPSALKAIHGEQKIKIETEDNETIFVSHDKRGAETICSLMRENKLRSIHSLEPSLGDLFIKLTGGALA